MTMDQTRANDVLTWMHGGSAPAALTAPIRCRLMTVNGSASSNGTEVATGGGYTAGAGAPSTAWAASSGGSQATNAAITVTNYPRAETVVGVENWDSNGTPKRVELGALGSSKVMAAGDNFTISSGAMTSAVA